MSKSKLLLDTDIGSDVDDALALAVLLGSPGVDLLGVTTVYGDTAVRARLAARLISLAAEPAGIRPTPVPVVPGAEATLSGREVWWAGHEGKAVPDLDAQPIDPRRDAPAFLAATAAAHPGEVDILAIGPLTNIALALRDHPGFERDVRHLYVMGGHFGTPQPGPEHNIRCDAEAARIVFGSRLPITATGLEITTQLKLGPEEVGTIAAAGPLGDALEKEIAQFWRFHGKPWNNPHDPIAALTLITPQLFRTTAYDVTVGTDDADEAVLGRTAIGAPGTHPVLVTDHLDTAAVSAEIVRRIVRAGNGGG